MPCLAYWGTGPPNSEFALGDSHMVARCNCEGTESCPLPFLVDFLVASSCADACKDDPSACPNLGALLLLGYLSCAEHWDSTSPYVVPLGLRFPWSFCLLSFLGASCPAPPDGLGAFTSGCIVPN